MRKSDDWRSLCDPECNQKDVFPNCFACDIALEYKYHKQIEEQAEQNEIDSGK